MKVISLICLVILSFIHAPYANASGDELSLQISSGSVVSAGSNVSWKLSVKSVDDYRLSLITLYFRGPNDEPFRSYWQFPNLPSASHQGTTTQNIVLQTGRKLMNGEYKVEGVEVGLKCTNCIQGRDEFRYLVFVREINSLSEINFASRERIIYDFRASDFTIKGGDWSSLTVPSVEAITLSSSTISPGEKLKVKIDIRTPTFIRQAGFIIRSDRGRTFSFFDTNDSRTDPNQSPALFTRNGDKWNILFEIEISEAYSPGKYSFSSLSLDWNLGSSTDFLRASTDNWGSTFWEANEFEKLPFSGVQPRGFSYKPFGLSKLSLVVLDGGQGLILDPIWTKIDWKSAEVRAGDFADLVIDANGQQSRISKICVGGLIDPVNGNRVFGQNCNPSLESSNSKYSESEWVKMGTFTFRIYIPRNTPPGDYILDTVIIETSNCFSELDTSCKARNVPIASTYFSNGKLAERNRLWPGFIDPSSKSFLVTKKGEIPKPSVSFTKTRDTFIEFSVETLIDVECTYSPTLGVLSETPVRGNLNVFQVNDLEPDSSVGIRYLCKSLDGEVSTGLIQTRTQKPIPPALPQLNVRELRSNQIELSFRTHESFRYEVTVSNGKVNLGVGSISITDLKPGDKTAVTLTVFDRYGQSTTSEPYIFELKIPEKPKRPVAKFMREDSNSILFTFRPELGVRYTATAGRAKVLIRGGIITISKSEISGSFRLVVTARDEFGQISEYRSERISIGKRTGR